LEESGSYIKATGAIIVLSGFLGYVLRRNAQACSGEEAVTN